MPDSSELKKPSVPSGERNGWMWASFCARSTWGSADSVKLPQRVLARLAELGHDRSWPSLPSGPASVISRLPAMSVAKW